MQICQKRSPDKGLEPLTSGLKVPRSTNWANRALFESILSTIKYVNIFVDLTLKTVFIAYNI